MPDPSATLSAGLVPDDPFTPMLTLLRALGIFELRYALSGGGDSGETMLEAVVYAEERLAFTLPDIPFGFGAKGEVRMFAPQLDDLVANVPDGDWVNNEGGYGDVTLRPFAEDICDRVECDMTYREEGDYGDDEDGDEEDYDPIAVADGKAEDDASVILSLEGPVP